MGTRLDFAIDPLACTSKEGSKFSVRYSCNLDREYHQQSINLNHYTYSHERSEIKKSLSSMDRSSMLDKHKVESIRQTMQAQEEVFRHQLRELHRLYSVQKMLMEEVKKEMKQNRNWATLHGGSITNQQYFQYPQVLASNQTLNLTPQASSSTVFQFNNYLPELSPTGRERSSGSYSGEATMRSRSRGLHLDLERPATLDQQDFSAADQDDRRTTRSEKMSIDPSDADESNTEVELTLSIGLSSSSSSKSNYRTKDKELVTREIDSLASFRPENGQECSGPSTPMSSSSTTLDQERKQPCWLFQGLSINRTN